MDLMKAPPLLHCERPQYGVIEHPGAGSESLFGVCKGCVHGDKSIVEPA